LKKKAVWETAGRLTLKEYVMVWNQLNYLKTCPIAGCCEHGSGPSSYIKRWGISEDGLCFMDFNYVLIVHKYVPRIIIPYINPVVSEWIDFSVFEDSVKFLSHIL
jgi:hypothetical protein